MKKNTFLILSCVILMLALPSNNVNAMQKGFVRINENTITTSTRADVIVRKYRNYHGVLQYRRWNETRGVWVDPDWINA